ncbi:MAG: hypothetical protein DME36_05965 [Verrucomicrobia bacterium]|nr:MAG: hypothetical protein DME36_05965 [Verrucomicrobiota bacterium]
MFTVNHVISAKFGGREECARNVLSSLDWSAAAPEFRLAKAVLQDQVDAAAKIMFQIGSNNEIVSEHAYHSFPLFRTFRLQESFLQAYEKIFGHPFVTKVQESADVTQMQLEQSAEQGPPETRSPQGNST